jgi:tryptophanyl-tRNA synthetase
VKTETEGKKMSDSKKYLERKILMDEAQELEQRIAAATDPSWRESLRRDLREVEKLLAECQPEPRGRHV